MFSASGDQYRVIFVLTYFCFELLSRNNDGEIVCFADDTAIVFSNNHVNDIMNKVNVSLNQVRRLWSSQSFFEKYIDTTIVTICNMYRIYTGFNYIILYYLYRFIFCLNIKTKKI